MTPRYIVVMLFAVKAMLLLALAMAMRIGFGRPLWRAMLVRWGEAAAPSP